MSGLGVPPMVWASVWAVTYCEHNLAGRRIESEQRFVGPLAAGLTSGSIGALFVNRIAERLLVGIDPTQASTLLAVCLVLLAVSILAALVPARRALRVDSTIALRWQ